MVIRVAASEPPERATDEEDFIISIDNDTGEVVLEQVGKRPSEVLAPNLAEFLAHLKPTPPSRPE